LSIFSKENKSGGKRKFTGELMSCVKGEIIRLDNVKDNIFSSGILGEGYAVIPEDSEIYSPVSGRVLDISDNGLSITVKSDDGLIVLVHIEPTPSDKRSASVNLTVKVGDTINSGDNIGEIDFGKTQKSLIAVIITNSERLLELKVKTGISLPNYSAATYSI